tara:strand:+ start:514 stop:825 length:312 start_codon:yes stop_codon:yes gene_type:complete
MIALISILSILLLFFIYFSIKFALIILKMQDVIENSLDLIDEKYKKISDIHNIPVFFDSPEIRRLLREIEDTKYIILDIARNLSSTASNNKEDEEINEVNDIE